MLARKFHMCTDDANTTLFKAYYTQHKHVLFWLHFYVWSGTVYVSLYKHTWFRLSADLRQTLCWWLKHTHTQRLTHFPELNWTNQKQINPASIYDLGVDMRDEYTCTDRRTDIHTSIKETEALSEYSCVARCAFESCGYECVCTLRACV